MDVGGGNEMLNAPPESPPGSPPPLVVDHQYGDNVVKTMDTAVTLKKGDEEIDDDSEWEAIEMIRVIKELKRKYGEEVWAKRPRLQRDIEVKAEMARRR